MKKKFKEKHVKIARNIVIFVASIIFVYLCIAALISPSPSSFAKVMVFYLITTFSIFLVNTTSYYHKMISFRKGFYLIFMSLISLSLFNEIIDISNWQLLLQLAAAGIFIDLALFQTPGISKIWNTEFDRGEYTLKTLSENQRVLRNNTFKALTFHKVIAEHNENYLGIPPFEDWQEHREMLTDYFLNYTKPLDLKVYFTELTWDGFVYTNFREALAQVVGYHGITKLSDDQIKEFLKELESGDEVLVESDLEETVILMPYFGTDFSFLLSVVGKGEIEANQVDAMHLINMAYIYEMFLVS